MNVFEVVDSRINEFQEFDGEVTAQGALDLCYERYGGPSSALGFDDGASKSNGNRLSKIIKASYPFSLFQS